MFKHYDDGEDTAEIVETTCGAGYRSKLRGNRSTLRQLPSSIFLSKPSKNGGDPLLNRNCHNNNLSISSSNNENTVRRKRHNLNGVYGGKGDYFATGLRNTGNFCYMNSVLQCLIKSDNFFKMLMTGREGKFEHQSGSLSDELRFLAMVLRSGEYRHVTPQDFRLKIIEKLKQFSDHRQQDAHEFLTCLLHKLKEELASECITTNYEGDYEMSVTCKSCGHVTDAKLEPFNSLHINITEEEECAPTLRSGIEKMLEAEKLETFFCEKCQRYVESTKNTKLGKMPEFLAVSIKRFGRDKYGLSTKDSTEVSFTPFLDISDSSGKNNKYELESFINHYGGTNGGHYTACCKDSISDKWLMCNDSSVTEVQLQSLRQRDTYILFYRWTGVSGEGDSSSVSSSSGVNQDETPTNDSKIVISEDDIEVVVVLDSMVETTDVRTHDGDDLETSKGPVVEGRRKRNLSWKAKEELDSKKKSKEKKMKDSIKEDLEVMDEDGADIIADDDEEELFCKCKKPAEGIMIDCLKCRDWFHTNCIDYICEECTALSADINEQRDNDQRIGEPVSKKQTSMKADKKQKSALKATEEALKKKYAAENDALKANIKDLERKLAAKNKALEKMTVNCQRNQEELKSVNVEKTVLEGKIEVLHTTVKDLKDKVNELETENKTHQEVMESIGEKVVSDGEERKSEEDSQKKIQDMKTSHAANLKEKNAEIRNLKTTVDVLEKDIQDRNQKIESLKEQLEACQHEKERVEDISDILSGLKGHKSEVVQKSAQQSVEKSVARLSSQEEESSILGSNPELHMDACVVGKESNSVCLNMFMDGNCEDKSCSKHHSINLKKVRRGICVYEFDSFGSCPWGKKCMYTHEFPPEIFKNQNIVKHQKNVRMNVEQRNGKQRRFGEKKVIPYDRERLGDRGLQNQTKDQNKKESGQGRGKNTQPRNLRYQRRDGDQAVPEKGDVVADSQINHSFLELIRPMIMDQLEGMMKGFFKKQENHLQRTVKKYMSSQQFKTV